MVDFAALLNRPRPPTPTLPPTIIVVTGHRPHKLHSVMPTASDWDGVADGYDWSNPLRQRLRVEMTNATTELVRRLANRTPRDYHEASVLDTYLSSAKWSAADWRSFPVLGVTGAALGVDQDCAGVWRRMGVPYLAAVPFPGQDLRWTAESRRIYAEVLRCAAGIVEVSSVPPADDADAGKMLKARNDWMSMVGDGLIAVFDGSGGGTASMVRRWGDWRGSTMVRIDPRDVREDLRREAEQKQRG